MDQNNQDKAIKLIGEMYKNQAFLKDIYKEQDSDNAARSLANMIVKLRSWVLSILIIIFELLNYK